MIITDEELMALLDSEEPDIPGFYPITLFALDSVAYESVSTAGLPSYVCVRRIRPDTCWQWDGLFSTGAIALYAPAAHEGKAYLPHLQRSHPGVYSIESDWLGGLADSYQQWCDWLSRTQVLLLEDHPFQGAQIQQMLASMGLPCAWVQDETACVRVLSEEHIELLVCDLSLAEHDAISVLMNQPQYQESRLPIVLLSAHDQTLIDAARRLLHDAGFNIMAAFSKPLPKDDLFRVLKSLYLGPQRQQRLGGLRTIRSWHGYVEGQLALLSNPPLEDPLWLAVAGLPARWEQLRTWLSQRGREPSELTLLIHRRDNLLTTVERFALVLQASLAGSKLALLLDNQQHLPFELLERLPLQALLLGHGMLADMESLTSDSLLGRFITRARELSIDLYVDDPFDLLDSEVWSDRGVIGRW
ncbi:response regulator [Aeromonas cavernicola]|uniref:Response regulatory domain-containing protein n=1 Tax=Aeromonas cavernicola TaxID=1006623 RepID=A0A2H9U0V0_9GAMM|nr:response regulator [Aeromonas cavernicola]PJG57675.1 hypothetical protein CUC53_16715 [Aeromonas cavernicola]